MAKKSQQKDGEKVPQAPYFATRQVVYVGPSIKGLQSMTTLIGFNDIARKMIQKDESYKRLFVEPVKLSKAQEDLKSGGLKEVYEKCAKETF